MTIGSGRRVGGQALVEFALVFPIIVLLVFGFIDVGRAVFFNTTLTSSARNAARVASVNQLDPVNGPFECNASRPIEDPLDPHWTFKGCAIAAGGAIGVLAADVTVAYATPPGTTLSCSPALNVGCLVSVTVAHTYEPITPLAGLVIGSINMTSTSSLPVERVFP